MLLVFWGFFSCLGWRYWASLLGVLQICISVLTLQMGGWRTKDKRRKTNKEFPKFLLLQTCTKSQYNTSTIPLTSKFRWFWFFFSKTFQLSLGFGFELGHRKESEAIEVSSFRGISIPVSVMKQINHHRETKSSETVTSEQYVSVGKLPSLLVVGQSRSRE